MKSKECIASTERRKLPHTDPFWPYRMRENGKICTHQVGVKGTLTQLVQKVVENTCDCQSPIFKLCDL